MGSKKRKIAVFTGNRAEYGLQYPILQAIDDDTRLEYYLLVSGAHLKEDFGRTLSEIEANGFKIFREIKIELRGDTLLATTQALGSGITNISHTLNEITPDLLLIYGDRFEAFSALVAGTQLGIPTAHVEGGDYTEGGALDDSVRHAMTKLAHIHFTTNQQAADRVRSMGEEAWRVHNVGFPALDLIVSGDFAKPKTIYQQYNLDPQLPILIFTQHSVATEFMEAAQQVSPTLLALEEAGRDWGCQTILTYPNDDAGGKRIIKEISKLESKKSPFIQIHPNLGRYNYHGVLNVADACIGNSSSGIKETPAFGCPCINIGGRQNGRLRGDNVIDTDYNSADIKHAIWRCLNDKTFKKQVVECINPYGGGEAGKRIAEVLATVTLGLTLTQKKMSY